MHLEAGIRAIELYLENISPDDPRHDELLVECGRALEILEHHNTYCSNCGGVRAGMVGFPGEWPCECGEDQMIDGEIERKMLERIGK